MGETISIKTQDGWDWSWEVGTTDDLVDGIGPVDQFANNCWAMASCIPVGPTCLSLGTFANSTSPLLAALSGIL